MCFLTFPVKVLFDATFQLLNETKDITPSMKWRDAKKVIEKDERFTKFSISERVNSLVFIHQDFISLYSAFLCSSIFVVLCFFL